MKLVEFNVEKYKTNNFELVTASDRPVEIGVIDDTKRAAILGWFDGFSGTWDINGNYLTTKGMTKFDLKLKPKKTVVHITVTRNKSGKINVYGCADRLPNVYKRSGELLKRLTVEIDD